MKEPSSFMIYFYLVVNQVFPGYCPHTGKQPLFIAPNILLLHLKRRHFFKKQKAKFLKDKRQPF
jgi:hypothetical protein